MLEKQKHTKLNNNTITYTFLHYVYKSTNIHITFKISKFLVNSIFQYFICYIFTLSYYL